MRGIKNWLNPSIEQVKFTDLSVINIESDLCNKTDKDKIINHFAMSQRHIILNIIFK